MFCTTRRAQKRGKSHLDMLRTAALAVAYGAALVGCSGAPARPSPEQPEAALASPEDARARAAEAYAKGDSDLALRLYVQAADQDPMDADSLYEIGVIYEEREAAVLAARAFARAVQVDARHAPALERLGLMYLEDRQLDQAQVMLSRAVAADSSQWRSHNALGLIADALSQHQAAAAHYATALALRPGNASVLNNRGYSHYLAGDLESAANDFTAALAANPTYERAWRNLGLVYARQGDYSTARATLARVVSPHVAANDVGYIAMLSGDLAQAELLFAEAIRLSPRYYDMANQNAAEIRRRRAALANN